MTADSPWQRTHLAVPKADEALLAVPALDATVTAAELNALSLNDCEIDLQGRSLGRLRREAKGEAIRLARSFTAEILGDAKANAVIDEPLVVPGHQPALYHPGVWAKNFASAGIARRLGGSVLNLVVDNDIYSRPSIEVPTGTREEPQREAAPFDLLQPPRPWERSKVRDANLFRTFADRTAQKLRRFGIEPVLSAAWPAATSRLGLCGTLPECLTAARHSIEAEWGLHNLELPMSRLCETDSFWWFAGHLLAHLPRFNDVYNNALAEYRSVYRIKSRNHPVPSLEERGEWLEAPFWVWRDDAPHRRRVFARHSLRETFLADDTGDVFATLPLAPTMDACCAVEVLRSLPSQKIRFRTRALTTTLFARLCLADTFVHGIGGAKYDEMTDRIVTRFFGVAAPSYATVSASLYLPFAEPFDVTADDERRLLGLLRDLDQNPQRHLSRGTQPDLDRLIDEKNALVAEQNAAWAEHDLSRRERRQRTVSNAERFRRIQQITQKLADFTADQRRNVRLELDSVRRSRQANRTLTSREFSFALYPEEKLRPFLTGLT